MDGIELEKLDEYIRENWDSTKEQNRARNYKPQNHTQKKEQIYTVFT